MSRAMPFPTLWLVLPIKNQMNMTSLQMDGRTASRPWIRSDEVRGARCYENGNTTTDPSNLKCTLAKNQSFSHIDREK